MDDKIYVHFIQLVGCKWECVCGQRGGLLGARNSVSWLGWWLYIYFVEPHWAIYLCFLHSSICVFYIINLEKEKTDFFFCSQTKITICIYYFICSNGNNFRDQTEKLHEITYYSLLWLCSSYLFCMEYSHCPFHPIHPYALFTIHC